MVAPDFIDQSAERRIVAPGSTLLKRGVSPGAVVYVESGRVALGVIEGNELVHQLGEVQGPFWLEATAAVLNQPNAVDAVARTEIQLRRIPVGKFRQTLSALPEAARTVLQDVAIAHRRQTELAVSRLVKDAEARCAEWLLRHAQAGEQGALSVQLDQRKRAIAAQLGIAPETLSRVLRHLRERGLISGSGRTMRLNDPKGLRALAGA